MHTSACTESLGMCKFLVFHFGIIMSVMIINKSRMVTDSGQSWRIGRPPLPQRNEGSKFKKFAINNRDFQEFPRCFQES